MSIPPLSVVLDPLHLSHLADIEHGFFTRNGGVSKGHFSSLNTAFSSGDREENIQKNRGRIMQHFQLLPQQLYTANQIHSAKVIVLDHNHTLEPQQGDALVTNRHGLALGIMTADCAPILLADAKHCVIAALHGGWKGLQQGIIAQTLQFMEQLGAERQYIKACIGPAIGPCHYRVGKEIVEQFTSQKAEYKKFFTPAKQLTAIDGDFSFNLWGLALHQLQQEAIAAHCLNLCTYLHEDMFFSYRRAMHRAEKEYGRQLSVIVLKEKTS